MDGKKRNKALSRMAGIALAAAVMVAAAYMAWEPGPSTSFCFDKGTNGIWIGHQWYTGYTVKTGAPVSVYDRDELVSRLQRYRIKYVYIHAGPVQADGTIVDTPGLFFDTLKKMTPGVVYLPWIGGNARTLRIADPAWRAAFLQTLGRLHAAGFGGVHLDFEPVTSFQPGYLELLEEIRAAFEGEFFLSHATRRMDPFGGLVPILSGLCWSPDFYAACMRRTDQTVLMGYDTCLKLRKPYVAFIRYQTGRLLRLAAEVPGHRLMIGVPSYEDVPKLSDPRIENIRNAASGVRAALEEDTSTGSTFDGVAVYAHWTTDMREWKYYEVYWMNRLN
jgi:hypothetical protein